MMRSRHLRCVYTALIQTVNPIALINWSNFLAAQPVIQAIVLSKLNTLEIDMVGFCLMCHSPFWLQKYCLHKSVLSVFDVFIYSSWVFFWLFYRWSYAIKAKMAQIRRFYKEKQVTFHCINLKIGDTSTLYKRCFGTLQCANKVTAYLYSAIIGVLNVFATLLEVNN